MARGLQFSSLAVSTQDRIPRVDVLMGRAVEHQASAPRLAACGVQIDEAVAEEGGVEEAEAEDAGVEELAGRVGLVVDAGPQEAYEMAMAGAPELHYSEAADSSMLFSLVHGRFLLMKTKENETVPTILKILPDFSNIFLMEERKFKLVLKKISNKRVIFRGKYYLK